LDELQELIEGKEQDHKNTIALQKMTATKRAMNPRNVVPAENSALIDW